MQYKNLGESGFSPEERRLIVGGCMRLAVCPHPIALSLAHSYLYLLHANLNPSHCRQILLTVPMLILSLLFSLSVLYSLFTSRQSPTVCSASIALNIFT